MMWPTWSSFRKHARSEGSLLWNNKPLAIFLGIALLARIGYVLHYDWGYIHPDTRCNLQDRSHTLPFEDFIYRNLLRLKFHPYEKRRVALVTLTEGVEPFSVLTNTCDNRRFVGVLVKVLSNYDIPVIGIDQSYSPDSCKEPPVNDSLRMSFEQPNTPEQPSTPPIVLGAHMQSRTDSIRDADCLVALPLLDFEHLEDGENKGKAAPRPKNVHFASLLLNENSLKIPLSWWTFRDGTDLSDQKRAPDQIDGFALAIAKLANPPLKVDEGFKHLQTHFEHPYGNFVQDLQHWDAMDVLCRGKGKIAEQHPEWGDCEKVRHLSSLEGLRGKVVLIGKHYQDLKPFPGGDRYGLDLHGDYVEALLDGEYLRPAPPMLDFGSLAVLGVITVVFEFAGQRWPKLIPPEIAFIVSLCTLIASILFAALTLLLCNMLMLNFVLTLTALVLGLLPTMITLFLKNRNEKYPSNA